MSALPQQVQPRLRIIEATERIIVEHPIFLLFGQPGVGKTSLGFSAENAILLNFDTESALARAVNRGRAINVLSVDELRELEQATEILAPFSTVVIDPVGSCVDLMAAAVIKDNPKYGRDGSLTQQGWGVLKSRFRTWITSIRAMKKNVLFVAHHKEDKNGDTVFVRPDISGGSKDAVLRLADFVGFLFMNGKERLLDFSPTESWFGKNPARWSTFKVPPPEKAQTFMAQLFAEGREALGKISEASASIANQVQDWQADIQTYTTAGEFNRAIPKIQPLPAIVKPQVVKLLMAAAEARGIPFDRTTKTFVDVAAVADREPEAMELFR